MRKYYSSFFSGKIIYCLNLVFIEKVLRFIENFVGSRHDCHVLPKGTSKNYDVCVKDAVIKRLKEASHIM